MPLVISDRVRRAVLEPLENVLVNMDGALGLIHWSEKEMDTGDNKLNTRLLRLLKHFLIIRELYIVWIYFTFYTNFVYYNIKNTNIFLC